MSKLPSGCGTKKFGLPLAGVWGLFPQFISRENEVRTLEDRINGCMERSMNGRILPPDGREMKAMLTYIRFISAGFPTGRAAEGRGVPPLPLPAAASDPKHGEAVFAETCAVCVTRRTGRGSAGDRKMRRKDTATNSRHCGDRTAITTARAWHDRSRRLTLFAPTCRSAPITHTLYSARRMRSTLLFSSIVIRGRTGSATSEIFPTARSSPPTRPIRRFSARSRHGSI
jgi:mono/diheme cytochrome c family protein